MGRTVRHTPNPENPATLWESDHPQPGGLSDGALEAVAREDLRGSRGFLRMLSCVVVPLSAGRCRRGLLRRGWRLGGRQPDRERPAAGNG